MADPRNKATAAVTAAERRQLRITRPTKSSRAKATAPATRADSGGSRSRSHSGRPPSVAAGSDARSGISRPGDGDFDESMLARRRICIDDSTKSTSVFAHFGTTPPSGGQTAHYTALPGLAGTRVWLEADGEFEAEVVREYRAMHEYEANGAEYASFAMETLLRREARNPDIPKTRQWVAERTIEYPTTPETLWKVPPVVNVSSGQTDSFSTVPDCTYWISLQAFNQSYRNAVLDYVLVRQRRLLCPYLTVELPRNGKSARKAVARVAAASATALYNR